MADLEETSDEQRENLAKEQEIIDVMIGIYCRGMKHQHGNGSNNSLCATCSELQEYTVERNRQCPFLKTETKTFCQFCESHCYSPENREAIREVMRYAGPRMLWHRPVYAVKHLRAVMKYRKEQQRREEAVSGFPR